MPHARIINTEFKSKEDLELSIIAWQKWSPDHMPSSLSRYIVRTGEKSTMMTAVIIVDFSPVRTMYLLSEDGMWSGDHFCHAIIDSSKSSLDLNSVFIIRAWGI